MKSIIPLPREHVEPGRDAVKLTLPVLVRLPEVSVLTTSRNIANHDYDEQSSLESPSNDNTAAAVASEYELEQPEVGAALHPESPDEERHLAEESETSASTESTDGSSWKTSHVLTIAFAALVAVIAIFFLSRGKSRDVAPNEWPNRPNDVAQTPLESPPTLEDQFLPLDQQVVAESDPSHGAWEYPPQDIQPDAPLNATGGTPVVQLDGTIGKADLQAQQPPQDQKGIY